MLPYSTQAILPLPGPADHMDHEHSRLEWRVFIRVSWRGDWSKRHESKNSALSLQQIIMQTRAFLPELPESRLESAASSIGPSCFSDPRPKAAVSAVGPKALPFAPGTEESLFSPG